MTVSLTDFRALTNTALPDATINFFIGQAAKVVTAHLTAVIVDQAILDQIELYLAGHFYVISAEGGGITYKRTGQAEERYKSFGFDAAGFMATRFGQQACVLDPTNTLMDLSKKDRVVFEFETFSAIRTARESKPVDVD